MNNNGSSGKQPGTAAFQDDFTREFMDSPKEVKDGYYLFKSKTGGYTMLYPKNAEVDQSYYQRDKDNYEEIYYGENIRGKNITYYVNLTYENSATTEFKDVNLNILPEAVGYKGNYQKFKSDNKTIYYAKDTQHTKHSKNPATAYRFFSYINADDNKQGIQYIYTVTCTDKTKDCDINLKKEEDIAKMLMRSVEFKSY